MKNSAHNIYGDLPQLSVTGLGRKTFKTKYGDCSGIKVWGFHVEKKIWPVEYYKHQNDFFSWTKVDLTELADAPSHNSSNDPLGTDFKLFLENQLPDDYMQNKEYWVFNEATATIVIKISAGIILLLEAKDLLQFGERDICTLARHQLVVNDEILEMATKEFTGMVSEIINKRMWAGALESSDVMIVDKP
ncbi:unnamed protein product [Lactuca saligna]|uniref:Uncharacterized protein n=1 Tax=Lactuca saligna TaxID=75948 RepID=A0AA35ZWX5_LACSI|nr:unnamed protein product [Lactuca saligna]